jgi:lysophospholipase L1-like esterase
LRRRLLGWIGLSAAAIAIAVIAVVYFVNRQPEAPETTAPPVVEAPPPQVVAAAPAETLAEGHQGIVILHIGDSHTAADIFTGRVRDLLEERYGQGGVLLPPGIPQAGVRSNVFRIDASDGWDYERVRSSSPRGRFWLSGYTAEAQATGESIDFTALHPITFTAIDLSFLTENGGGAVDVLLDDQVIDTFDLDGTDDTPLIKRLVPVAGTAVFEKLTIRTDDANPVTVTGVTVHQDQSGVSYLSVGYPGATANIVLDIDSTTFADDLKRIDPDVVVLAFGTNEGFDDNLNLDRYEANYQDILEFIAFNHPDSQIVVVLPPLGSRDGRCTGGDCGPSGYECWNIPPNLLGVREAQIQAAAAVEATVWDWAAALPTPCAIERGTPAIDFYGPDRIHLTTTGYQYSAGIFADFLATLLPPPDQQ